MRLAEQSAFAPPFSPVQVQFQAPATVVRGVAVPLRQRLVEGAEL